jgi:LacI family transcriptional regulator
MARRPTIEDVAREAGVSLATVDRVLNRREQVREATALRVLRAAERLGYHATALLRLRLQDAPERRLGFVLQKRQDPFYQALGAALAAATQAAPGVRARPVIEFVDELAPAVLAAALRRLGQSVDALGVVAVDHPHISAAIEALAARQVRTFALLSDLSAERRAGYIGLDQRKAGRTAAWMIARVAHAPGSVAILVGSHRYLGQELAEISFRSYFREHAPAFRLLDTLVNLDDPRIAYEAALDVMKREPGLVGFYVAGGGLEGVIQALREEAPRPVQLVGNELMPGTRAGLIDGVVTLAIATPIAALATRAVAAMLQSVAEPPTAPAQVLLPFDLFVAENV